MTKISWQWCHSCFSHCSLFPWIQFTISRHWFSALENVESATSLYLNQWCPGSLAHMCVTRLFLPNHTRSANPQWYPMAVKSLVHFYTVVRLMKPTAVGFISLTTVLKVIQQIYTPPKKTTKPPPQKKPNKQKKRNKTQQQQQQKQKQTNNLAL